MILPTAAAPTDGQEELPAQRPAGLERDYAAVRACTEKLCEPLATEDYGLQSMPDASPVKWHLAHTSWFFETFVLKAHRRGYRPFHPRFEFLFNSYYNGVGPQWPRARRGLLSRPTVAEVYRYRAHVDRAMAELLRDAATPVAGVVVLGLNHEQQHQELILTDVKHALALNPLRPAYREAPPVGGSPPPLDWVSFPEGLRWVGHEGPGFAFDNETPRHRVFVPAFAVANRLVTNEEYLAFMSDGGYERAELWLSDGWAARQSGGWQAPLYWERQGPEWFCTTLSGFRPVGPAEPVCHVSFYEADAFARWAGARLPTEEEWETAAGAGRPAGHFLEAAHLHPVAGVAPDDRGSVFQMHGDVWQWTASAYSPYHGYEPAGAAGEDDGQRRFNGVSEYNGKFMVNQLVLRGASCVTPRSHARPTYRNFFPPEARWQFSGIRLAKNVNEPTKGQGS